MQKPVFFWQDKRLKKVNPLDLMFITTVGNYTKLFLRDLSHVMVRSTLSGILSKMPGGIFFKTHRAYAVSVYYIDHVERDHIVIGREAIPLAKQYYKPLLAQLAIVTGLKKKKE